jgi:hypothetical protein
MVFDAAGDGNQYGAANATSSLHATAVREFVAFRTLLKPESLAWREQSLLWRREEFELWRPPFALSMDVAQAAKVLLGVQVVMFTLLFIACCALRVVRRYDPAMRDPITRMLWTALQDGGLLLAGAAGPRLWAAARSPWVHLYLNISLSRLFLIALCVELALVAVLRWLR